LGDLAQFVLDLWRYHRLTVFYTRSIIVGALLLFTAGAEDRPTLIRQDLSRMELTSATKAVKALRDLHKGGASALVVIARELNPEQCSELKRQTDEVRKFGLAVTIAQIPKAAACGPDTEAEVGSALAGKLQSREPSAATVLVLDGDGIARLQFHASTEDLSQKRVQRELVAWEQGRQAFSVHCGHCHGDDGAETTYVGIKTLAGISTRMTDEKILDGGEQFGLVPISSWSQSDRDVLMQFIRGL
jgi:cytochrome c553